MEMHQVRYFLATVSELNFTKAAEKCNVSQPSLTRAIQQLEGELGGDLFRRERPHAQMTELGQRMLPLLKQCYDSALGAKSLASSVKTGEVGSLKLALSRAIDLTLITPHLKELQQLFNRLEFIVLRGSGPEIAQILKNGEAELAIASEIGDDWERLDSFPLFTEGFHLALSCTHHLAGRKSIDVDDLQQERLLVHTDCEHAEQLAEIMHSRNVDVAHCHKVASERDLMSLVEADIGIAVVPRSTSCPKTLMRVPINDFELSRTVHLYSVAGRQRTPVATAIMKMLRSADWSRCLN
jgi:DNA-binding transcriptional LysR family regulator